MPHTVQSSLLALLVLVGVVASTSVAAAAPNVYRTVTPLPVTHSGPVDTVAADVNGDGKLDLVVAEQTQSRVGVFIGNGDGTYQDVVDYWPGGSSPVHPVIADMDGDGKLDVVVGNALSASVSVMRGNGDGTFQDGASAKVSALGTFNGPQGVVVADFDRNGVPDVAVSTGTDSQKVLVLLGAGDGSLGAPMSISLSGNQADLAAGDVNGDGNPDLVSVSYSGTSRASVLLGNGAGGFASAVTYRTGDSSWAIRLADLDADGKLDIVTANLGAKTVAVLRGVGNGTFEGRTETAVGGDPRGLAIGDLDGDGKLDVVESWQTGSAVGVLRGNGDGTLAAEKTIAVGASTYAVALGDLDGDGYLDIVAPSYTAQRLYVLLAANDAVAPTTTDNVPAGWTATSPFRPTLTATDTGGGTVAATYYEVGSPPATPTTSSPVYNAASKPSMTNGQQISYFSVDTVGNAETVKTSGAVKIDTTRPVSTDDVPTTWQRAAVRPTLNATDGSGSGVSQILYRIGTTGTPNLTYDPANRPTLANGQTIRYMARDAAGNTETAHNSVAVKVDTATPTVTDDVVTTWRATPATVTLTPADTGGSGVDQTFYEVGATPATPTTASAVYDPAHRPSLGDGERIRYVTIDVAGNDSGVQTSSAARIDTAAPTTGDDVPTGWQDGPVTVTLTASDGAGSGVAGTYYEIGVTPATPTAASPVYDPGTKPVLQDGERIAYRSVDAVGNAESVRTSAAAMVDPDVPDTALGDVPASPTSDARPSVGFTTIAVGATFECSLDGEPYADCTSPYRPEAALADGDHAFAVRARSRAGLVDPTPATATFTVDTTPPAAPDLLAGPPPSSTAGTASIGFAGEPGATFACSVDGGAATPCTSPLTLTDLAVGEHTVLIDQTDAAGNRGAPLSVAFTVTKPADPPGRDDPEPGTGPGDPDPGRPAPGVAGPGTPGPAAPAPGEAEPTRLSAALGVADHSGRRPAVLIAGMSAVACVADRGRLHGCSLEARSLIRLRTSTGRRLPVGTILAAGGSAAGIAPGPSLAASLRLTSAGRAALARHPLGLTARLALRGTSSGGRSVSGAARVRLMASDTLIIPIAGRGATLPRNARTMLARLVRTVGVARAVRCTADTDASGDAAADRALTARQARAACDALTARGLKATRTIESRGSSRPRATNGTATGRALNRRVTIRVTL